MLLELAIKLDERTKKVLLVLLALFIILLLIFGTIYFFIDKYMKHEEKIMDNYMYDLCATKIVKNPKEFTIAVNYHERRLLFNNSKWALRVMILSSITIILLGLFVFKDKLGELFTKVGDIFPIIEFETVGKINDLLAAAGESTKINLPRWMPASIIPTFISKNPNFADPVLWISVVYYVLAIICFFVVLRAILGYIARKNRARVMKTEVFNKKLENLNGGVPVARNLQDLPKDDYQDGIENGK